LANWYYFLALFCQSPKIRSSKNVIYPSGK
jgi:hypothetical protein